MHLFTYCSRLQQTAACKHFVADNCLSNIKLFSSFKQTQLTSILRGKLASQKSGEKCIQWVKQTKVKSDLKLRNVIIIAVVDEDDDLIRIIE